MPEPGRRESFPVLGIGLGALLVMVVVVLLGRLLGMQDFPTPQVEARDPAEELSQLLGGGRDTARAARLGELPAAVDESSGVAVSRRLPGVLWTHNDGADARLFAVRLDGALLATVTVQDAGLEDWEDLALGPCPEGADEAGGDCLYLADTGDNAGRRSDYAVVVVPEPDPAEATVVRPVARVRFRYPEGPADTEGLGVTPDGELLLVTKGYEGRVRLYRLPSPGEGGSTSVATAELVGALAVDVDSDADRITAAAVSPDGSRLAVRSHRAIFLVRLEEPLDAPVRCEIGVAQPQGEGLDFLDSGVFVLTSERDAGRSPIVRQRCP